MATKKQTKKSQVKKILKRELVSNRKYKTTYKDIKYYFEKIYKDETKKYCYGQVIAWEWKRKGTRVYHLEMQPNYRNKKDFVDTLGHEMVHLYQMANVGDTGNHNKLFYSFRPKLNAIGLDL